MLERLVLHHLDNLPKSFQEAYRLLKEGGYFIVQERTPEDIQQKGSETHIRGYFFEKFPRLLETETRLRYESHIIIDLMKKVGFKEVQELRYWETKNTYEHKEQLLQALRERKGKKILEELEDTELEELIQYINSSIPEGNTVEQERSTIWVAVK